MVSSDTESETESSSSHFDKNGACPCFPTSNSTSIPKVKGTEKNQLYNRKNYKAQTKKRCEESKHKKCEQNKTNAKFN